MSAEDPRTLTELSDYIQSLVSFEYVEGGEGYERSADAMWKAAIAAFNLVAREVGATGFQASWAALKFYGEAMHIDCPFTVVRVEDALYPQYDIPARVQRFIDDSGSWLRGRATEKLAAYEAEPVHEWMDDEGEEHHTPTAAPRVVAHWRALLEES
jgi:hypothetical protein